MITVTKRTDDSFTLYRDDGVPIIEARPLMMTVGEAETFLDCLVALSSLESRIIRRALKRLRRELHREIRINNRVGWKPAPGRVNVSKAMLDATETLLKKFGGEPS